MIGAVTLRLLAQATWRLHCRLNKWAYALERSGRGLAPNKTPKTVNVRVAGKLYDALELPGYLIIRSSMFGKFWRAK